MGIFGLSEKKKLQQLWELAQGAEASHVSRATPVPPKNIVIQCIMLRCSNSIRIFQDSAKLVGTTHNPDTFYSRVKLLKDEITFLIRVENIDKTLFTGMKPSVMMKKLEGTLAKEEADMWDRCYDNHVKTAKTKKTPQAQAKIISTYFKEAQSYGPELGRKAMETIEKNRKQANKTFSSPKDGILF